MKKIEVEQGSPEWLAWRKTVITATDCPAIRGSSPWSTAYKCWQRKLSLVEEQKSNDAMERGKKLEPIIRQRFIEKWGINMTPVVAESSEYTFLGASLDGISDCGKYILEVKTGGEKLYAMAKNEIIPEYYLDQVQQQLLVSGAEKCFYQFGSEDKEKDVTIPVYPDPNFAKEFLPQARAFWKCIALHEAPPLQDSDYHNMSDNASWKNHAELYKNVCEQIKELELRKEVYRKGLINLCGDQNCLGEGVRVMSTTMRGRIDYDAIPEIKDVDLEPYRKASTTLWKVFVT
jgi:putative phage-type endonuclease